MEKLDERVRTTDGVARTDAVGLPPGPSLALLAAMRLFRDHEGFLRECRREFGDPFTLEVPLSPQRVVVTGHPDGVRDVFLANSAILRPFEPERLAAFTGPHALMLTHGEAHRERRKALTPAFQEARIRAFSDVMQDTVQRHTAAWPVGRPFGVLPTMQAISLEVIIRTVFGLETKDDVERFRRAVLRYVGGMTPALLAFPFLRVELGGVTPWGRFRAAARELHALIGAEVQRRRNRDAPGRDVLGMLLAGGRHGGLVLTDEQLRDELQSMLVAGYDTTAAAMAWAMYFIHREPAVLLRLSDEIAALGAQPSANGLAALSYLEAVCLETLRIHPVAPMMVRGLAEPITLRGWRLPAGTAVAVCAPVLHGDPELYPEPHRFRPERFLERKFSNYEFVAFGGGVRRCMGQALALQQMKIVLGTIVARFRMRLRDDRVIRPVLMSFNAAPATPVHVVVAERRA